MPIVEFWIALGTTVLLTAAFGLCLILDKRRSLWVDRRFPSTGRTCVLYGDYGPAGRSEHRQYTTQRLYREFKAKKWPLGGAVMYLTPCVIPTDLRLIEFMLSEEFAKAGDSAVGTATFRCRWSAFEDEHYVSLVAVVTEEAAKMVELLCATEQPVDVKAITELYAVRVLARCIFGKRYEKECRKFPITEQLAHQSGGIVWDVFSTAFPSATFTATLRKLLDHFQEHPAMLEELVSSIATERTMDANFLQHLKQREQQSKASDRIAFGDTKTFMHELVQNVFFVASGTILACLHEMGHNQDVQQRLHDGLKRSSDGAVDYLENVISETLRKYPPVSEISFMISANNRLPSGELVVPRNTRVIVPIYALHHDAQHYPAPERFNPERSIFRSKEPTVLYRPLGVEPLPVGSSLALLMVRVGLSKLLTQCTVSLTPKCSTELKISPNQAMPYPSGRVELLIRRAL
uniref:Uncharacterized protein n=1 Tax=Anopheles epiroticus TaxID=199890 RepID=A0A182PZ51_9DIPT